MTERIHAIQVGAPDPELPNSPILDESADNEETGTELESVEFAQCQFNGNSYADGVQICSGDELLQCSRGTWLRAGSCDPDNP
jgi:hypothetical protein